MAGFQGNREKQQVMRELTDMTIAQIKCMVHGVPQGQTHCELNGYHGVVVGKGNDGRLHIDFGTGTTFAVPAENVTIETQSLAIGPDAVIYMQQQGQSTKCTVYINDEYAGHYYYHRGLITMGRMQTPVSSANAAVQHIIDGYWRRKASTRNAAAAFGVVS